MVEETAMPPLAAAEATPVEDAPVWLYLDAATQQQKGPLHASVVKRLLRKGLLQPTQAVWAAHLPAWATAASVEPFRGFWGVWAALWYYLPDAGAEQRGPVSTQQLVGLFADGEVDGLTMVWRQEMAEWQPIAEVQALKEFLQEASSEMDREAQLADAVQAVAAADQVFKEADVEAFVAEDGKRYLFDSEANKWVTPEEKIEEDLEALREAAGELEPGVAGADSSSSGNAVASTASKKRAADADAAQDGAAPADGAAASAEAPKKKKKKAKKKSDKWKARKKNTWVYVNGLPLDVTVQEVHEHFSKCGVIQQDVTSGEPRIKLYRSKQFDGLNGDASVCFMKEASVELAVQLLDKSQIRPEWPIDVSPAVFTQKGDEFVKRKKIKIDTRAKVKLIEQQKALSWNEGEDGDRAGLRIVVIKHMFTPDEISDDAYERELEADINDECAKIGEVAKITLFPKHADGVVVIKFESSGSAATCVDVMNGRFFAGRKLECGFWDGTDYTHRESKTEEQERAEKFQAWLEGDGTSSEEEEEEDAEEAKADDNNQSSSSQTDAAQVEEAHSGRVLPPLDDSDDSDEEEDASPPAAGAVHAGRVMPDLDALEDDDDA